MYVLTNQEIDAVAGGGSAADMIAAECARLTELFGARAASQFQIQVSRTSAGSGGVQAGGGASRIIRKVFDANAGIELTRSGSDTSTVSGSCPAPSDGAEDEDDKKSKS